MTGNSRNLKAMPIGPLSSRYRARQNNPRLRHLRTAAWETWNQPKDSFWNVDKIERQYYTIKINTADLCTENYCERSYQSAINSLCP